MKRLLGNTIVQLLLAVGIGIVLGVFANEAVMKVVLSIKQISGQIIFFLVPLIIFGFVAPSIAALKSNASRVLIFAFSIAYLSTIGAAFFGLFLGYELIPFLQIEPVTEGLRSLPAQVFILEIPPVMSVMSALVLAVLVGLSAAWINSGEIIRLLDAFQKMILLLVKKVLLPVLPFFVAANFCVLSYEGTITRQLPVFIPILLIVVVSHYIWLTLLYLAASLYSGRNGWNVLKYYAPAYFTALGTMSSAATLGVALECARKSPVLRKETIDITIPLFANIHLCGSVLTEVFFVLTVSQLLYGTLPGFTTIAVFIFLLGFFAIGAPGVPGGTVLASLGLIISVLGFDESGTALLITIFALQDSFGTACNVAGDGALALITDKFTESSVEDPVKVNE